MTQNELVEHMKANVPVRHEGELWILTCVADYPSRFRPLVTIELLSTKRRTQRVFDSGTYRVTEADPLTSKITIPIDLIALEGETLTIGAL